MNQEATNQLEQANALGFATIAEMKDHQQWLDAMAVHRQQVSAAIRAGASAGVIDLRGIFFPSIH